MKRREIWTIAGGDHTSKPRPCVIAQAEGLDSFDTVVIMPITSFAATGNRYRIPVSATQGTGLHLDSFIEVEKLSAVKKKYLGQKIGEVSEDGFNLIDEAIIGLLGINVLSN